MKWGALILGSVLAVACTTNPTAPSDGGVDAEVDALAPRDAGPPRPDAWVMPAFDTSTTWNAMPLACPSGPARRDPRDLGTQRRFALSVLHFNLQYVAGGLTGVYLGGHQPFPDWGDDRIQDAIITESLVPVLDLLDRHPTWTLSIEMQGYLPEVLLARHRTVAQHLSDLVRSGQVELVSFHYSDQLFLAYPREHMRRSHELNDRVLADACLAASGPVFTQEGQFGIGMADLLGTGGDDVLVLPKNLFSHQHGDGDVAPYYTARGMPVVIGGRGVNDTTSGFQSVWVYMDDAELLATGGLNPYTPPDFVVHPEAVADFESQLVALESAGFVIAGIGDWVATLRSAGVTPTDLPPTFDGDWQPDDTENVARWMGNAGAWGPSERDDAVLTGNTRAGRMLLAAETAVSVATAAGHADAAARADLDRAWRDLFLGEVSDATGWNPASTETYYGLFHGQAAETRARDVAARAATAMGLDRALIDTAAGTMMLAPGATPVFLEADPTPPFTVAPGTQRTFTATWQRYIGDPDHHVLTVAFPAATGHAEVTFPWTVDRIATTPALLDGEVVTMPLSAFTFTTSAIPVNDGPLELSDGVWLVLDTATVALAARLDRAMQTVRFRDDTLPTSDEDTWVFHVIVGTSAEALAVADALNVHPSVTVVP